MNQGSSFFVVVVLCCLSSDVLTCAAALSVSLTKISPDSSPVAVVGDTVILRCDASNLQAVHIIEWTRHVNDAETLLARNGSSLVSRYAVWASSTTPRYEHLIYTAERQDAGSYQCRVKNATDESGTVFLSSSFYVSVHYFPADPICQPQGPFVAQQGSTRRISCTSDMGNPVAQMDFVSNEKIYPLEYSDTVDTQTIWLDLNITAGVNTLAFECKIASPHSFPSMEGSCFIGPVNVSSAANELVSTAAQTPISTTSPFILKTSLKTPNETSSSYHTVSTKTVTVAKMQTSEESTGAQETTYTTTSNEDSIPVAIVAGIAGGGGFLLFLLLISVVIACACLCGFRGYKKEKHSLPTRNSTQPIVISRPSSEQPVTRHPSSSSHKQTVDKETSTAAKKLGQPVRPVSVKRVRPSTLPKPSRANKTPQVSTHDNAQIQPAWELDADKLDSRSQIHLSDRSTLRISSHRKHTNHSEKSYSMHARGLNREPLYAEVQKSNELPVGEGDEKVHIMDTATGGDSIILLTNPTYAPYNDEDTHSSNGSVESQLEYPAMKKVTWKA